MKKLNESDALHCANIFNDYFNQFDRIDQYMRDQKMNQILEIPATLPGMGTEDDMFIDFDMSPNDMDLEVVEVSNYTWDNSIKMISSHNNMVSIPGKVLKLAVREKNSDKFVGFIRFGSPFINCKPRNELLGGVPNLIEFNKTAIMGFVIIPTQPFGYNYLGGKLLAGICCTHLVREMLNEKYGMNLVMFETTSLYGDSKSSSQYDGMKPFIRYKGLTQSDFIPLIHGESYARLVDYVVKRVGPLVKDDVSSKKLKTTNAIISLIKRSISGEELERFNKTISDAKELTERKRYYVSNYGIENYIDIVNGKTNEIVKSENFDRYNLEGIISWWKKIATKRYEKLKTENRLRTELEIWTPESNIDIIR